MIKFLLRCSQLHTNSTDSSNLASLALLCPGLNGACVYQARGLYNYVYKKIINDSECESMGAARQSALVKENSNLWDIKLFPNPSTNYVIIESNQKIKNLTVKIEDLSGRIVLKKVVKPNNFIIWRDNSMNNQTYGMIIRINTYIGTQGNSSTPSDNYWSGSNWTSTNRSLYAENTDPMQSKIYTRTLFGYASPNNGGAPLPYNSGSVLPSNNAA